MTMQLLIKLCQQPRARFHRKKMKYRRRSTVVCQTHTKNRGYILINSKLQILD